MAAISFKRSSLENFNKYNSLLVGNEAFYPSDFELLETAEISTNGQTMSITSIPSTYKHLQLRGVIRRDAGVAVLGGATLRINGSSTTSDYVTHKLNGNGSSVSSNFVSGHPGILLEDTAPTDGETSNIFGAFVIDILDYADTSKNTTVRALTGVPSSSESDINLFSGLYIQTTAVTELSFSDTLIAGSRMSLYGIKAA